MNKTASTSIVSLDRPIIDHLFRIAICLVSHRLGLVALKRLTSRRGTRLIPPHLFLPRKQATLCCTIPRIESLYATPSEICQSGAVHLTSPSILSDPVGMIRTTGRPYETRMTVRDFDFGQLAAARAAYSQTIQPKLEGQPAGSSSKRNIVKNITVINALGGFTDISIKPGTTSRDIKKQLNLAENFVLTQGRGTEPFQDNENLYEILADGSKIYASTEVILGV